MFCGLIPARDANKLIKKTFNSNGGILARFSRIRFARGWLRILSAGGLSAFGCLSIAIESNAVMLGWLFSLRLIPFYATKSMVLLSSERIVGFRFSVNLKSTVEATVDFLHPTYFTCSLGNSLLNWIVFHSNLKMLICVLSWFQTWSHHFVGLCIKANGRNPIVGDKLNQNVLSNWSKIF